MKVFTDVTGTQETIPNEIEFNVDTVYVRSNIRRIEINNKRRDTVSEVWCYDETQYDLKEYHEMISKQVSEQQKEMMEALDYSIDLDMRLAMIEMGMI